MPLAATTPGSPPAPFVLAEELLCAPAQVAGLVAGGRLGRVVGQVLSVRDAGLLTPGDRARAAALATSWRTGSLSRATAAWVWSGPYLPAPDVVDVGTVVLAAPLSDLVVVPTSTLRTRALRCSPSTTVVRVGGVAVTDPASTASECARLLPRATAATCLLALHRSGRASLQEVGAALTDDLGARGRRSGLALVEELLDRTPDQAVADAA